MKFRDGQFYAAEKVSPRRMKTPEGFLVCEGVPISRVGTFEYSPLEAGIRGRGGKVLISRTADELFTPETMTSFEGKPIVVGHDYFADPQNIRQIAVGHIQNVRRGEGEQSDLLLADLFLDAQRGIDLVERGDLDEVSCGYDARVVDDGDGKGHQVGIVGNHLALVKKARCGEACKIGDGSMSDKKLTFKQRIRRLFRDGDEDGLNACLDEMPTETIGDDGEPTPPPVDPASPKPDRLAVLEHEYQELAMKIAAIEKMLAPKPEGDEDETPTGDEDVCDEEQIADEEEAAQVIADADDLCPGMARPTGDAKGGKFTKGMLNRIRRVALKGSGVTTFGDSADLKGKALDIAFKAAVAMKRQARNPRARIGDSAHATRCDNAALNAKFKDFWSKK